MDLDDDEFDDEFGIKQPTLVESLKRILDEYPDDGQILKELIQNAEDASASTVKFMYDEQSYPVDNLHCPEMADFNQSPSLIVYNDGVFTKRDWNTIGNLGLSKKKGDPIKVGKFGLGFKSVFHITDCPMIVSGKWLGIIEPHQRYFRDESGKYLSGFRWCLTDQGLPTGHLEPFLNKFGFTGKELKGTIFRFPLRQRKSAISATIYTTEKVNSLLKGLTYKAYMKILFLTNLNEIEVFRLKKGEVHKTAAICCSEKSMENVQFGGKPCLTRENFKQSVREISNGARGEWTCVIRLKIIIEIIGEDGSCNSEEHSFIVSHFCGTINLSSRLSTLTEKQGNMPWVSCAIDIKKETCDPDGHVFVFLPLPQEGKSLTGLPVHVNGYFAISQNRRHLKWPSDEQLEGPTEKRDTGDLDWNYGILSELLPIAYLNALKAYSDIGNICKYLPNPDFVDEKWKKAILRPVYSRCLSDAYLLIEKKDEANETLTDLVASVLTDSDYCVVRIAKYIADAIETFSDEKPLIVTPHHVREALKKNPSSYKILSDKEKLQLLEYILQDDSYSELQDIALLPLENGKYAEFCKPQQQNMIYVEDDDNPLCLLPGVKDRFLKKTILDKIEKQLLDAGQQGYIQIKQLNPAGVVELLPFVLYGRDKHYCSNDELLIVDKHKTNITEEWYKKIWQYVVEKMHGDISKVMKLHLILVEMDTKSNEWKFGSLETKNAYIVSDHHSVQLSENICTVLKSIGVIVIPTLMDEILRCPEVVENTNYQYINKPTASGIVQAFCKLFKNDKSFIDKVSNMSNNDNSNCMDELRTLIGKCDLSAISDHVEVLKFIPMFEKVGDASKRISVNEAHNHVLIECSLPINLAACNMVNIIDGRRDESAHVLKFLCCNLLDECQVLMDFVFPHISDGMMEQDEIIKLMKYVLPRNRTYVSKNAMLMPTLKKLPFIRTTMGKNCCASDLYDFSDECLVSVFGQENFPPYEAWHELGFELREIGLRSRKEVTADDLVNVVQKIADSKEKICVLQKKIELTIDLVKLINSRMISNSNMTILRESAWLLPLERPREYPKSLKWKNMSENRLVKPCEAINSKYLFLVGAVLHVVDLGSDVASFLGVEDCPSLPQLATQLKEIVKSYCNEEKTKYLLSVIHVYDELQQYDNGNLKNELQQQAIYDWMWHGNGFTDINKVCINKPEIDVEPFCFHLPPELSKYNIWCKKLGVAEHVDYCNVLREMKLHYDSTHGMTDDSRNLGMIISILNHVYTTQPDIDPASILLPVVSSGPLRLLPPEECTICSSYTDAMFDNDELDERINVVHPQLAEKVAERFGAYSLMKRLVNDADDFGSECWGQHETLLHRLRNIARDYVDGSTLIKELVQNADDAGATEVKLLWDERQNKQYVTHLLHDDMKHCQGPALWVCNNAVFTQKDLDNIKKLGGATKEDDSVKIGRFGLGFNSVYNLTDVPSFISEENLVIFDPHTTFLNLNGQPGILINLKKKPVIFQRAPDQIAPFQGIFGCQLSQNNCRYDGTLFRLPLRTAYQAEMSEICHEVYKAERMKELLDVTQGGLDMLLLFTQHVQKVSVFHLRADAASPSEMEEMFSVEKALISVQKPLPRHSIVRAVNRNSDTKLLNESTVNVVAKECFDNSKSLTAAYVLEIKTKTAMVCFDERWLITSYSSNNERMIRLAKDLKTLPLGMAGIKLDSNDFSALKIVGRLFCHLPLPIETGLPFHVNGFFAVSSNRRSLEVNTEDDVSSKTADWNIKLGSDSVLQAHLYALDVLKEISRNLGTRKLYLLFPHRHGTANVSRTLCESFYTHITSNHIPIFHDGKAWRSFEEIQFLSQELLESEFREDIISAINSLSSDSGHVVVKVPMGILDELLHTNEIVERIVREKTWTSVSFIKLWLLPNLRKIEPTVRDHLLRFALQLSPTNKAVYDILANAECFPVNGYSDVFRKPSHLVDPFGNCRELFDVEDKRFPSETFSDQTSRNALLGLKMIGKSLPMCLILDRANSIKHVSYDKGLVRVKSFLQQLEKITSNTNTDLPNVLEDDIQKKLVDIPFLPVKRSPDSWNELDWKGDDFDSMFKKPSELYSEWYEDLIGSILPVTCSMLVPFCVQNFLKIDSKIPSIEDVLQQLQQYNHLDEISPENGYRLRKIYSYLDKHGDSHELLIREGLLCIHIGNCSMPTAHVAEHFKARSACLPYLSQLAPEFSIFKNLIRICNIKSYFSCEDYVDALERMKSANETDVIRITSVINCLCDSMEITNKCADDFHNSIYLIDNSHQWRPSNELSYNNKPWFDATAGQVFAHESIPYTVAQQLGIKTSIDNFLDNNSINFAGGISFGQKEKLTTRLKRLIEGYPADETIMKELLQNADDAGASEIHFILDTNTYKYDQVIGDNYHHLQGPALLVYNDKPFTKKDLDGIQNLGVGTKGVDPTTTGQYGVGFNCVYSLTDTPQFFTDVKGIGKVLCMFDPNYKYVPRTSENSPGIMFIVKEEFKLQFPDVFEPFSSVNLPLKDKTLFRFPLRNEHMASASALSDKMTNVSDMKSLLQLFAKEAKNMMLFLKSIEKISISIKESLNSEPIQMFSVKANSSVDHNHSKAAFISQIREFSSALYKKQNLDVITQQFTELHEFSLTDNEGSTERWIVSQVIGFGSTSPLNESVANAIQEKKLRLLPSGGAAFCLNRIATNIKSQVYCSLPLPIQISIPVHINGHFALDETRRALWRDSNTGYRTDWNKAIMNDVAAMAHCLLIEHIQSLIYDGAIESELMCKVLPQEIENDQYLLNYVKSLYQILKNRNSMILLTHDDRWFSLSDSIEGNVAFNEDIHEQNVLNAIVKCHLPVVKYPSLALWYHLQKFGYDLVKLSPSFVLKFFRHFQPSDKLLSRTPLMNEHVVLKILQYCGKVEGSFLSQLDGVCLCVTAGGHLIPFASNNPIFYSQFKDLLPSKRNMFLSKKQMQHFESCYELSDCSVMKPLLPIKLEQLMHGVLPSSLYEVNGAVDNPSMDCWLKRFWEFLVNHTSPIIRNLTMSRDVVNEELLREIKCFDEWSLLPVVTRSGKKLYPIKWIRYVLNYNTVNPSVDCFAQLIKQFKMLTVDKALFRKVRILEKVSVNTVLNKLACSFANVGQVLAALTHNMNTDNEVESWIMKATSSWTIVEFETVLNYFASYFESGKANKSDAQCVRSLPIHETVAGIRVQLPVSGVYVIPRIMPFDGMLDSNIFKGYLKESKNRAVVAMHKCVGCIVQTEVELYVSFILPVGFEKYDNKERKEHLRYLRDNYICFQPHGDLIYRGSREIPILQFEQEVSVITTALHQTRFLPDQNGEEHTPSELYNPEVDVFKVMLHKSYFPDESFVSKEWLSFLGRLGLRCSVSTDELLEYARKIECEGHATILEDGPKALYGKGKFEKFTVEEKSKAVAENIFNRNDLSRKTLDDLKEIKFIPAHEKLIEMEKLCPRTELHYMISFSRSVTTGNMNLCWSCVDVLPLWGCPISDSKCDSLSICKKVSKSKISQHCQNICRYLTNSRQRDVCVRFSECIEEMMLELFKSLDDYKDLHELKDVPCIFTGEDNGSYFVYPRQVVIAIDEMEQIVPYLFAQPIYCAHLQKFLLAIGVSKKPTVMHYANILKDIHIQNGNEELNPNDLNKAIQASQQLYSLLETNDDMERQDFFLLTTKNILCKSSDMFYEDGLHFRRRLLKIEQNMLMERYEKVETLTEKKTKRSAFDFVHLSMKRVLSKVSHIKPISTVIIEDLSESCRESAIPPSSEVLLGIQHRILEPTFQNAVHCLIRHFSDLKLRENVSLDKVSRYFQQIRIFECQHLQTVFTLNGKVIEGSEENADDFWPANYDGGQMKVYSTKMSSSFGTNIMRMTYIVHSISKCIVNNYISDRGTFCNHLTDILFAESSLKIMDLLHRWSINVDDEWEFNHTLQPTPGSSIPMEYHHLLSNHFCSFDVGDFVGYKTHDDILDNEDNNSDAVFIYALVVERIKKEAISEEVRVISQIYKVDIGYESVELFAYELYKILRHNEVLDLVNPDELGITPIDTLQEITELIRSAWTLEPSERNKILLRLLQNYLDDQAICDHIKLINKSEEESHKKCKNELETGSNYSDNFHFDVDQVTSYIQSRHARHLKDRRRCIETLQQNSELNKSHQYYFASHHCGRNPQLSEARKWMQQAMITLKTIHSDVTDGFHFMTLFKCQLTCEQALVAMVLARDSEKYDYPDSRHNLDILCGIIDNCPSKIRQLAARMQSIIRYDRNSLLYPNRFTGMITPHNAYCRTNPTEAQQTAEELVKLAEEYVINCC